MAIGSVAGHAGTVWNQFKTLTKNFSASDRGAMFNDTASNVHRLPRT